jgi:hypothetical protein
MLARQRDLRRSQRKPKRQAAWIRSGGACMPIPCVIWDLSEEGARLAPARLNIVPDLFILNLTRDGKSRRGCRVVWRKKPHIGVRFVEPSSVDTGLDAPPPAWRRAASSRASAVRSAGAPNRASASQIIPLRYSDPAAVARSPFRPSLFALAFLLLLLVASAIFYVAGLELAEETPWATRSLRACQKLLRAPGMERNARRPDGRGFSSRERNGALIRVSGSMRSFSSHAPQ